MKPLRQLTARYDRPSWLFDMPEVRNVTGFPEYLYTKVPAVNLETPLLQTCNLLANGHDILNNVDAGDVRNVPLVVVLACSGKGKSRMLFELKKQMQNDTATMCIAISFNGDQNLLSNAMLVGQVTSVAREQAILHLALRLVDSTFKIENFEQFSSRSCTILKDSGVKIDVNFFHQTLSYCVEAWNPTTKHVTLLVDESGRLPKLLKMDQGDDDEFSVLRALSSPARRQQLGFSVMVVQAGLGDFAERTPSGRKVVVVPLLDQIIDEIIDKWILYLDEAKAQVVAWGDALAKRCVKNDLQSKAKSQMIWEKLIFRPLAAEYAPLARALQYLTEVVLAIRIPEDIEPIATMASLGSIVRSFGVQIRNEVDKQLVEKYPTASKLLTPAVIAPGILPSGRLQVKLTDEIDTHKVSYLLSEAVYANSLEFVDKEVPFIPTLVPAFLRRAAMGQQLDMKHLQVWWNEVENVIAAQTDSISNAGKLLETGVCLWTYTILLALSENKPRIQLSLADIFPETKVFHGLQSATYLLQVPNRVLLTDFDTPLNESLSETHLTQFIQFAREGIASILDLCDEQAGVDSIAVLPLIGGNVLLLGLEPHGGSSGESKPYLRHRGHPQDKRARFLQALPSTFKESRDIRIALLYITHDELEDEMCRQILQHEWTSTSSLGSINVNLLLMERKGLQKFMGPLWPLYCQARYMSS